MTKEEKRRQEIGREVSNWVVRTIATIACCQSEGVPIPPLNYQKIVFGSLCGDDKEMAEYYKQYVESAIPLIEKVQAARLKREARRG